MARKIFRSKMSAYRFVFAFSMSLALGISLWVKRELGSSPYQLPAADSPAFDQLGTGEDGQGEQVETLLLDSILSIIQNYYVDEERVDNRKLLDIALYKLTEDEQLRLKAGEHSYDLSWKGRDLHLEISEPFQYRDLLEHGVKIARFLEEEQPESMPTNAWTRQGMYRFLNAMLTGLDPHSALLDPSAYKELRQGTEGAFGGVGVVVGIRDNLLTVIKPLPRSPAAKIGINKYDRIMKINEVSTYGVPLDSLVEHMRGAPGTVVNISLLRDGALSPQQLAIKREVIQVDSVESKIHDHQGVKILHLTIESFSSRTSKEVRDAIHAAEVSTQKRLGGIVLDLRSNPGGLLDQAVQVSDLFLKNGRIVSTKGRREEAENAGLGYNEFDYPLTILINGESASASEIVAGALQDNDRAIVIGQPSFGKGSVQTIFELPGEQALKLTIARYYTPRGRSIQNVGIMPQIWLQPVTKGTTNSNLLGMQRYKSERFLLNHLNAEKSPTSKSLALHAQGTAEFKGYYLSTEGVDDASVQRIDHELDFAMSIIKNVASHYGIPTPQGTRRAGHWLMLTGKQIKERIATEETQVRQFLTKQFQVNWAGISGGIGRAKGIHLELPEKNLAVAEGDTVKVPWIIKNLSNRPVGRLSIFARSDWDEINTYEALVGYIGPKETKRGFFEIPVYMGFEHQTLSLQMGLAHDSLPTPLPAQKLHLTVEHRDKPRLSAQINFQDDKGGRVSKTLEAMETGILRVSVKNESNVEAKKVRVKLVNLAGKQVNVEGREEVIASLSPGARNEIVFSIAASKTLISSPLGLGVEIEGEQMAEPVRQYFMINTIPNSTERISNLISR